MRKGRAWTRWSSVCATLPTNAPKRFFKPPQNGPAGQVVHHLKQPDKRGRQKTGAASPSSSTTAPKLMLPPWLRSQVNQADGQVWVKRVVVAHDCGLIINPDGLRNQIEGNVIQATSRTLKEEVKFDNSRLTSLEWTSYPILRFPEIPEVVVELIDRPDQPAVGAGEATTSAIPAAIANAIFDATGVRFRTIPFTPDRVKAALS